MRKEKRSDLYLFILVLSLSTLITGCATTTYPSLWVTPRQYAGTQYVPQATFGPSETPTVCVQYPGKTVTVKLINLGTNAVERTHTKYSPEGTMVWFSYTDLPQGSYRAEVYISGVLEEAVSFTVER